MTEDRSSRRPSAIEGTDAAALGTAPPPEAAPPGAAVDAGETHVPGEPLGSPGHEAKPWSTTLAYATDDVGVGNDPHGAQDGQFPDDDDEAL